MLISAIRQLTRAKTANIAAIISIGVGVGCAAAAFCVADPIFFRSLPYPNAKALFVLSSAPERNGVPGRLNLADFAQVKELPGIRAAAFQPGTRGRLRGNTETLRSMAVTADFFDVLGVALYAGRKFTQEEHDARSPVCLLTHDVARAVFGLASDAVGRSIVLEDVRPKTFTVVGVLRPDFLFPDTRLAPGMITPAGDRGREVGTVTGDVQILARLEGDSNPGTLALRLQAIVTSSEAQYPKLARGRRPFVVPLSEELFGNVSQATLVIFAAVLSIALLGCANLYHVFATQLRKRARDLNIATALGASRRRIVASLGVEYAIIAVAGGVSALFVAQLLRSYMIGELPEALAVLAASAEPINARVAIFALAASILSVALASAHPVLEVLRGGRHEWLNDRSVSRTRSSRRTDRFLIVLQSAATFLVLMFSLTILRSLVAISSQPIGFDYVPFRLVQPMPPPLYFTEKASARPEATRAAYDRLKIRFGASIAANVGYPTGSTSGIVIAGEPAANQAEVPYYAVTGDFFNVAGLRLVAGQGFGEAESLARSEKAVVDLAAAGKLWPASSPLGKFLVSDDSRRYEVVGVVETVQRDLLQEETPRGAVFLPIENRWGRLPMISYRDDSEVTASEVGTIVEAVFPGAFVSNDPVRPFRLQLARHEFLTALIGTIAAIDILIVVVGIWSLSLHQLVAERREFGVRMALGARPANILTMILGWRIVFPVVVGITLGAIASLAFAGRVAELSFKTSPLDGTSLTLSAVVVMVAAIVPVIFPAIRMSRDARLLRQLR